MGRHSAADGATVHPLVADALARRSGEATGTHGSERQQSSSPGWPAPPPGGGGGLGWPGDLDREPAPDRDAVGAPVGDVEPGDRPRRGWRRLFGAA